MEDDKYHYLIDLIIDLIEKTDLKGVDFPISTISDRVCDNVLFEIDDDFDMWEFIKEELINRYKDDQEIMEKIYEDS